MDSKVRLGNKIAQYAAQLTAEIFRAFIYGVVSLIGGGFLFENGKTFVKTAGRNQSSGKIEALPFFFGVLVLGWLLQQLNPIVTDIVRSIPPVTRAGAMILGGMFVFNYSVPNFNYDDEKSIAVYVIGFIIAIWPFI